MAQTRNERLCAAMKWSRGELNSFREERRKSIKQFIGTHYGDKTTGAKQMVNVNLLQLATQIYIRQFAARTPKVLITTMRPELRPAAADLELACTFLFRKVDLLGTLRLAVLDAMFSMGVIKTGVAEKDTSNTESWCSSDTEPFAAHVSLDDWVHDMSARQVNECQFMGHRWSADLQTLRDSGEYKGLDALAKAIGEDGQPPQEANETAAGDRHASSDEKTYRTKVWVWELWLPREHRIVYLADPMYGASAETPLREIDYHGPEKGPYHILGFGEVPDSTMPLAPVQLWRDLHDLINEIWVKIGNQARRQKDLLVHRKGSGEGQDSQRLTDAQDGQGVGVANPESVKPISLGGANQTNLALAMYLKEAFSWLAGNLDTLGGLSPMAETLGQEQILLGTTSKQVADLGNRVELFSQSVCQALAFLLWDDPAIELPLTKRIPGSDVDLPVMWDSSARRGKFFEYQFEVQPYSAQQSSPRQKGMQLLQLLQGVLMPLTPVLAQQGKTVNVEALLTILGKYFDLESELSSIIELGGQEASAPDENEGMKSPVTQRNYTRTNRGGVTTQGKTQALIAGLIGQAQQPKEQDLASR